jgi:hypothetical protein
MPRLNSIASNSDWLTVKESMEYAKVSRSRLYSLMEEPLIRTYCLRRKGRTKGIRFVSKSSLDAFFDQQCQIQCSSN